MAEDCEISLAFLGLHNYVATKVEVFNQCTGDVETITLVDDSDCTLNTGSLTNEDIDAINLLLYTKERFNLSNDAYHELSMLCSELPRSCQVQKRIRELNEKWNLKKTPGDADGVQQKIADRLRLRLEWIINNSKADVFGKDKKIRVKLSGDGTNIGKRLHVVNITFNILEEGKKAMAADGNHIIAVIKVPENYENLEGTMADIRSEVASLSSITIGKTTYNIEWYLGGDWKFLACVSGLGAATANQPCIWCKCELYNKFDKSKEWSLSNDKKGARTITEIQNSVSSGKCNKAQSIVSLNSPHPCHHRQPTPVPKNC